MSEKKHKIGFDRDAHGWVVSCVCGWREYTFSKKAANLRADKHMGYPAPKPVAETRG